MIFLDDYYNDHYNANKNARGNVMAIQTARVTFLTSPDFKAWLVEEAGKADVSVSEFIRLRCQYGPSEDELMLLMIGAIEPFGDRRNEAT